MNVFNLFRRRATASVARERLQILLAHERSAGGQPELLGVLREEILAAIAKHISVNPDSVVMRMDRGATVSTLEIEVDLPNETSRLKATG
jgi:cell division topological specificity factor